MLKHLIDYDTLSLYKNKINKIEIEQTIYVANDLVPTHHSL